MSTFLERLEKAAIHAGVGESQATIARSLELNPQTVNRWFKGGEPSAENCFDIGRKWKVDAEWLKSGEGEMLPKPSNDLPADERELLKDYRSSSAQVRRVIRNMARAARKAIITIAAVIPPFLAPQHSEASTQHNLFCESLNSAKYMAVIHIVRLWLRFQESLTSLRHALLHFRMA